MKAFIKKMKAFLSVPGMATI